jgi:hypothetical protein
MTEEQRFTLFLLELYKRHNGISDEQLSEALQRSGVFEKIYENYFIWHIERPENAFAELDQIFKF